MKKILALALAFVALLTLTACTDTWHGDEKNDAYAFVTTSTGESCTLQAATYMNEKWTAHARAIKYAYEFYLEDGVTATIVFACTACDHSETVENVSAPDAYIIEFECFTGDDQPDMTEAIAINFILGSPPAEEG